MEPVFFKKPADFRKWLDKHHAKASELLVGFYKTSSGKPCITWSESVDEALCYGWIDGVRKSMGGESYTIRFTPRRPGSTWSAINIKKIEVLTKAGKMKPAGEAAFALRKKERSAVYSHEQEDVAFSAALKKQFKASKDAWKFFDAQSASYKRMVTHWVMSAKQEATQQKRLGKLMAASEAGQKMR
jgi:uncharacterized protein YdeI (YjbR/CyaY-like superfamily)